MAVEEAARMREALAQAKGRRCRGPGRHPCARRGSGTTRQEHAEAKRVTATAMDDMLQHLEQAAGQAEHTSEAPDCGREAADARRGPHATHRAAPGPAAPPPTFVTPEILLAGIKEAARALAEQAEAKRETAAAKDDDAARGEAARKREALAEAKRGAAKAQDSILAHVEAAARARQDTEAKRETAALKDGILGHVEEAARVRRSKRRRSVRHRR